MVVAEQRRHQGYRGQRRGSDRTERRVQDAGALGGSRQWPQLGLLHLHRRCHSHRPRRRKPERKDLCAPRYQGQSALMRPSLEATRREADLVQLHAPQRFGQRNRRNGELQLRRRQDADRESEHRNQASTALQVGQAQARSLMRGRHSEAERGDILVQRQASGKRNPRLVLL